MGIVTELLDRAREGDATAQEKLFSQLYSELDRLARSHLSRGGPMTLIDAPALIHEVYLRLTQQAVLPGKDRRAFLAYASRAMRSVIVDYVRARRADRRGGGEPTLTLNTAIEHEAFTEPEVASLGDALQALARIDERSHRVVEMRYFGGLEIEEIAEVLSISPATVKRDWQKARAFLLHEIRGAAAETP